MQAMILAAGRGERLRPYTDRVPKPLLEVRGLPLVVWHIKNLRRAGFKEIVINHAHLGAMLESELGDGSKWDVAISYSAESDALETAGGIAYALHLLKPQPFLVVNGDIFCDFDFSRASQVDLATHTAHLVLVDNPVHNLTGDFALANGKVRLHGVPMFTFSGIAVYRPEFFDGIVRGEKAKLSPLLKAAMATEKIGGEHFSGLWLDVGTPERLAQINNTKELWIPAKSSAP